ncbi:MAG: hypothetical protein HYT46_02765 [Candidatus Vogelbacteria bacterium]|nr:hypothetical protein [Candidatus Vogelbacteria bacterium]
MKISKIYLVMLLAAALGMIFFFGGGYLKASGQGLIPFGGRILVVEYCCNGVAITVGAPRPGRFLITSGTIIFPFYNVFTPGPNVLGTALPAGGTPCFEAVAFCLVPLPVLGIVSQIGSSAF